MHPADIKAKIQRAGDTQSAIAERLKITPTTVNLVINGRTKSRRVAEEISTVVGCPLNELWPGAYEDAAA